MSNQELQEQAEKMYPTKTLHNFLNVLRRFGVNKLNDYEKRKCICKN